MKYAAAGAMLALAGLAGCVSDPQAAAPAGKAPARGAAAAPSNSFLEMMAPGRPTGAALERLFAEAARHPLGSRENPVRADMPAGQRAYLQKLRCSNGAMPAFSRSGNLGPGVYGSIVDLYVLTCAGGQPARSEVVMDMYFPGYLESRPVPGFTMGR